MLYASVLRPPAFGKILESFDATEAKKVAGVIAVFTIGEKAKEERPKAGRRDFSVILPTSTTRTTTLH
jgi:isoquinoline 1-oxidoreductase beta subunit